MDMEQKKRVALVGCGSIAAVHAQILAQMEQVELVAFVDICSMRAETFKQQYGTQRTKVYTRLEDMLAAEIPDVVHICTPHDLHVSMAQKALVAGASVFMEKPPAITEESFRQLMVAEAQSQGMLGVCFQNRYNATTRIVDEIIQSGRMGKVIGGRAFVTWNRTRAYYEESEWRGRLEREGGGALINQSIHSLDLLLRWMGRPKKVEGVMANMRLNEITEVEDTVCAFLDFGDARRACFYASNAYVADVPVMIEIACEKGMVRLEGKNVICRYDSGEEEHFSTQRAPLLGKSYWGDGHDACVKDFYECLAQGKAFPQDLKSVENTFETMRRIYEAAGWRRF